MRFAVLCPPNGLYRWQAECVQALAESGEAELVGVLALACPASDMPPDRGLLRLYNGWLRKRCRSLDHVGPPAGTPTGATVAWPPNATPPAAADFIVAFVEQAHMPAMGWPPHGVWHFRFGGLDASGAELPGFRQVAHGRRTVLAELVAVDQAGSARVLHRAVLKTRRSHRLTLDALLQAAPSLCVAACRRHRLGGLPTDVGYAEADAPQPGVLQAVAGQTRRTLRGVAERIFLQDRWTIAVLPISIDDVLAKTPLPSPQWLQPPRRGRFHADPFPVIANGACHVLFEMWDDAAGRGWIAAAPLDHADGRELRDTAISAAPSVLDAGCHMSYPAVFEFDGATYCTPEMSAIGGLRIFRMGATPLEWTPVAHLLGTLPLIDQTIFEHAGRWWLLATLAGPASDAELHAWHAASPFGPWAAHALNPVKSDVRSSRPAGAVFRARGGLYRPAQDCSESYGGAVVLNRIVRLDPGGFEEIEVVRIEPRRNWQFPHGLHTFNVLDGRILIDAKRRVVSPSALLTRLRPDRFRGRPA